MDVFAALSLVLAAGFPVAGLLRRTDINARRYRKGLGMLVMALILYYPVSNLFQIGIFLSFVARPVGFILGVMSLRSLCLALLLPTPANCRGSSDGAVTPETSKVT